MAHPDRLVVSSVWRPHRVTMQDGHIIKASRHALKRDEAKPESAGRRVAHHKPGNRKVKWIASEEMPTGWRGYTSLSPRASALHPICPDCPTSLVNGNVVSTHSFFTWHGFFFNVSFVFQPSSWESYVWFFPASFAILSASETEAKVCLGLLQRLQSPSDLDIDMPSVVDTKTNTENQPQNSWATKAGLKYFAMGEKSNFA